VRGLHRQPAGENAAECERGPEVEGPGESNRRTHPQAGHDPGEGSEASEAVGSLVLVARNLNPELLGELRRGVLGVLLALRSHHHVEVGDDVERRGAGGPGREPDKEWEAFTAFLAYDVERRRVLFFTNAIESLNTRYRRAMGARGDFPPEQAASETLYLVTRGLDPEAPGRHDGRCGGSPR